MNAYRDFRSRMPTDKHQQIRLLVQAAAQACEDKKGEDTRILELDPADSGLADFFLVTSASNDRQAVAIADEIEIRLKREFGAYANSVEGRRQGEWILLDYVDFVVHVFLAERRAFYDIERLRKSAKPFTPAEFDQELKNALAEKTRAVRTRAASTQASAETGAAEKVTRETAARATPARKTPVAKAPVKSAAKKAPAKKTAARSAAKAPAKKAAKSAAKKAVKPTTKKAGKAPAKKKAAKKATPRPAAKKVAAKKAARKK